MDGKCVCTSAGYFGNHCEHKKPCNVLRGDLGDIWTVRTDENKSEILAYDRPTYSYEYGFKEIPEGEKTVMAYTGSRWFSMRVNG